jgi:hypothetical protein
MLLGDGHFPVEVVFVHHQQHPGEHFPFVVLHGVDVFSNAGEHRQVGHGPEFQILAVGAYESGDVFSFVGPAKRQNQGLFRLTEKPVHLFSQRGLGIHDILAHVAVGEHVVIEGVEFVDVDARGNNGILRDLLVLVETVLGPHLLPGAGDDEIRVGQNVFFHGDAAIDFVFLDDIRFLHAVGQQFLQLGASQGMPGVDEGQAEDP